MKRFKEVIDIPDPDQPGKFEWWTVGLDVDGDRARPYVSHGGIADPDAPVAVMKAAVAKWAEWLATVN